MPGGLVKRPSSRDTKRTRPAAAPRRDASLSICCAGGQSARETDEGARRGRRGKGVNARHDKRDAQTGRQTEKCVGERNKKQRGGGGGWMLKGAERLCMKGRRERGG